MAAPQGHGVVANLTREVVSFHLKFTPTGAEDGEDVSVVVRKGELLISEVVKPGRRSA